MYILSLVVSHVLPLSDVSNMYSKFHIGAHIIGFCGGPINFSLAYHGFKRSGSSQSLGLCYFLPLEIALVLLHLAYLNSYALVYSLNVTSSKKSSWFPQDRVSSPPYAHFSLQYLIILKCWPSWWLIIFFHQKNASVPRQGWPISLSWCLRSLTQFLENSSTQNICSWTEEK